MNEFNRILQQIEAQEKAAREARKGTSSVDLNTKPEFSRARYFEEADIRKERVYSGKPVQINWLTKNK